MALTARQRNKLPRSAFVINSGARSNWAFPVPTKAQARRAGISEAQRLRILRNANSRAAQRHTRGSFGKVSRVVSRRAPAGSSLRRSSSSRASSSRRRTSRRRITRRR